MKNKLSLYLVLQLFVFTFVVSAYAQTDSTSLSNCIPGNPPSLVTYDVTLGANCNANAAKTVASQVTCSTGNFTVKSVSCSCMNCRFDPVTGGTSGPCAGCTIRCCSNGKPNITYPMPVAPKVGETYN